MDHLGIRPVSGWLENFWASVEKRDPCWIWTGRRRRSQTGGDQYGQIEVPVHSSRGPAWRVERVHRLAWELTNGHRVPEGKWILHACDTHHCVRPEHLRVGTAQDNHADMKMRGRYRGHSQRGHPPTNTRLTPDDVRMIRAAYLGFRRGTNVRALAERYGICLAAVYDILKRKTWAHV